MLEVWPEDLTPASWGGSDKLWQIGFPDAEKFHAGLIEYLAARATEEREESWGGRSACGTKIYFMEDWQRPEADFLTERAKNLFCRVLDCSEAHVDLSWASVYQRGDFCPPHSHLRAMASLVYMLAPGDSDDPESGRFWIVDPRLGECCGQQAGCMTTPLSPELRPGALLMFPGEMLHEVWPYRGEQPRITLSWNIAREPLPHRREYHEAIIENARERWAGGQT